MSKTMPLIANSPHDLTPSLAKIDWQKILFSPLPQRLELLRLKPNWFCSEISIRVHRNAPFEYIEQTIGPFLAYASFAARFELSDYDDSLPLLERESTADLEIIWLDYERYSQKMTASDLADWIETRCTTLRQGTKAPILIANWTADHESAQTYNALLNGLASRLGGLRVFDLTSVQNDLGAQFFDRRLIGVGATNYSGRANLLIARSLGLEFIPGILRPRLKAIALDLDNTLYAGVLGEDGPRGLTLSPAHQALQENLKRLGESGMFLAIISKNAPEDVEELFEQRPDFPLKKSDFSALSVSWEPKSQGLASIAAKLRIGLDTILYLDDNTGELAEVSAVHPTIKMIYAAEPDLALATLRSYPNLRPWVADKTDSLRVADLAASEERAALLAKSASPQAYLASLETQLTLAVNDPDQLPRAHSLANKTNQFILTLRRFTEAEVAAWIRDPVKRIVTVAMSDRLSDSGNIAVVFLRQTNRAVEVIEFCVSCRALGRNLESFMLIKAIDAAYPGTQLTDLIIHHTTGPRNEPGRSWLQAFAGLAKIEAEGYITLPWPPAQSEDIGNMPIVVQTM